MLLYLSQLKFWLMDGPFKIVPNKIQQINTIHGSICQRESKTFPMVFAHCTNKNKCSFVCYLNYY